MSGLSSAVAEPAKAETIEEHSIRIQGARVRYLEAAGPTGAQTVLLLHGARFSSETWRELGSIEILESAGFRVLALDLPGYGRSESSSVDREKFLGRFLDAMELERVAIVSPSMSGGFSLPFVARHPERVFAYVPVAPAGIEQYRKDLKDSEVPTLIVWGGEDRVIPLDQADLLARALANDRRLILEGASHPCYLDEPDAFHQGLLEFFVRESP